MHGPPRTLRVALADVPWPLPPRARTRDETTLARTLRATALRVDARGRLAPGLCRTWHADGKSWRFRCREAQKVGAAIPFTRVSVRDDEVTVALPFRWRRFPYLLTGLTVPGTRGPFAVERARPGKIVVRRGTTTIVFTEVEPHQAAVRFRRGELDEAPVPLGDIRAAQLDAEVGHAVRVTRLLAVDVLLFDLARGALAGRADERRAYWHTTRRGDYEALVPERSAPAAVSLLPGYAPPRALAREFRAWRARIPALPPSRVGVGADPEVSYGRDLLVASWRDVGLGARAGGGDARLVRLRAPYAQDEALLASLLLARIDLPGSALFRALGETAQRAALQRADDELFRHAAVVPVAWAVDARFVSPRVRGWREDRLGVPDYTRVRFRASSRRP